MSVVSLFKDCSLNSDMPFVWRSNLIGGEGWSESRSGDPHKRRDAHVSKGVVDLWCEIRSTAEFSTIWKAIVLERELFNV